MSEVEQAYRARVEAMSAKERIAMSAAMFQWTREILGRQLVAELGEMSPDELKWRIALRQYGAEPQARELIERELRHVPVEVFRATLEKIVGIFNQHAIRFHLTGNPG